MVNFLESFAGYVSENREIVRAKNRLVCITEFHDLKYAILLLAGRLEVYAYLRAYHKIVKFLDKFHNSNSLRLECCKQ